MMLKRSRLSLTLGIVASVLGAGCQRSHAVAGATPAVATEESVVLVVQNHNWSNINIYVLHDGRTSRLTTVTAAKDLSIQIPPSLQGETGVFRLAVHRIGGEDSYVSEPLSVHLGHTVQLTVESDLQRSSVGIW